MKIYRGYRIMQPGSASEHPVSMRCVVTVEQDGHEYDLPPRNDIRNHSPTGFEWGYGGSGPAQLALALVADCSGPSMAVPAIYQRVKRLIADFPRDGWILEEKDLIHSILRAKKEVDAQAREWAD